MHACQLFVPQPSAAHTHTHTRLMAGRVTQGFPPLQPLLHVTRRAAWAPWGIVTLDQQETKSTREKNKSQQPSQTFVHQQPHDTHTAYNTPGHQ